MYNLRSSGAHRQVRDSATEFFASLPPGGPAIISVIEKRYKDAIVRNTILATNSNVSGQNFLTVTLYAPVGYTTIIGYATVDDNSLGQNSIQPTQIAKEFQWYLLGVPMKTSLLYAQNKYGPFGFATGASRAGDHCIYAWQHIEHPRFVVAGAVGIRLRVCDARASEQQLLSLMYDFAIVGYLPSPLWNPYGAPPRVSRDLGALSAPLEPTLPVAAVPARPPAPIRKPPPELPIEGPIVPLPEPGGAEAFPTVPLPQ